MLFYMTKNNILEYNSLGLWSYLPNVSNSNRNSQKPLNLSNKKKNGTCNDWVVMNTLFLYPWNHSGNLLTRYKCLIWIHLIIIPTKKCPKSKLWKKDYSTSLLSTIICFIKIHEKRIAIICCSGEAPNFDRNQFGEGNRTLWKPCGFDDASVPLYGMNNVINVENSQLA